MRMLATIVAATAIILSAGCDDGRDGQLCDRSEDCDDGFVCLTQVINCAGEDCWGTCERECADAADCEGGEICIWIHTAHVCRPTDYQEP